MKKNLLFLLACALLAACSPKISSNLARTYAPLGDDEDVAVLEVGVPVPEDAELIGDIKIGDTGFTATKNGTYEEILALAKSKARAAGGNVISLTEHRGPDGSSTIHRIKANILRVADISSLPTQGEIPKHPEHPDYAVIYFYRTGNFVQTPYDVHLGNDVVYRSRNNTKVAVKVDKPGTYEIWGKTETREAVTLQVEMGKEYYVKTFVHMGAVIWRPSIEVVTPQTGKAEWDSIRR